MVMGQRGALTCALIGAVLFALACSGNSKRRDEALDKGQSGGAATSAAGAPGEGGQSARGGAQATGGGAGLGPLPLGVCPEESSFAPGLLACDASFVHRPEATGCALPARADVGTGVDGAPCTSDSDCAEGAYCLDDPRVFGADLRCTDACTSDSDCGLGKICLCEASKRAGTAGTENVGRCAWTGCASDADCGPGSFCRASILEQCDGGALLGAFKCQSPHDECSGSAECASPGIGYVAVCAPPPDGVNAICYGVEDPC